MADQGLGGSGPVEVGAGPGEDPPRKRLRHEDHEVRDSSGILRTFGCKFGARTPQVTMAALAGTGI